MFDYGYEDKVVKIFSPDEAVECCWGLFDVKVTEEQIEALKEGKILYFKINCEEYAITLTMKEKNVEIKVKHDD